MSNIFAVLFNGNPELEYDRSKPLSERQHQFLEKVDQELSAQFVMGGEVIRNAGIEKKAQFVAINLVDALLASNDGVASAMCSYLATRVPNLKQVKVTDNHGQVLIDLIFDEDYTRQVTVQFTGRGKDKPVSH
ncbi:MAG: hypothetical protein L0Z73_15990 [Gammaproteobacteria bacterium]|nr:hypothetical protein [Gammaproteobacteria bacterium]